MEITVEKPLTQSLDALAVCRQTLEEVTNSCCDSSRSPRMITAFGLIDNVVEKLETDSLNAEKLQACIEDLRQAGSVIGDLHVSCCTEIREPLFQKILKQLNVVHSNMMGAMGFSH